MPLTIFIAAVTFPFAAIVSTFSIDLSSDPAERLVVGVWIGVDAVRPVSAHMITVNIPFVVLTKFIDKLLFPFGRHEGIDCK